MSQTTPDASPHQSHSLDRDALGRILPAAPPAPAPSSDPHSPDSLEIPPPLSKTGSWRAKCKRYWRRSTALGVALSRVFRSVPPPPPDKAREFGLDIPRGVAHVLSIPVQLLPLEAKLGLLAPLSRVYPHVRESAMRAWLRGELTGGRLPLPSLRMDDARVEVVLRALDWLETLRWMQLCAVADQEKARLVAEQERVKEEAAERARVKTRNKQFGIGGGKRSAGRNHEVIGGAVGAARMVESSEW